MTNPDLIPEPFAQDGDKNPIPLERAITDPIYRASWKAGFPPDTRLPKDVGGEAPDGLDFNGVLNIISQAVVFLQKGNAYQFDASLAPYPIGALVRSNDNLTTYQSTVVSNSNNPNSNMTGWRIYNGSGFIVDNLTTHDSTKALSAAQGKVLQDNKLGKDENAVSATKLQTARTINNVLFDGTANINLPLLGYGQTWQDVSSSRASGATYTNTTQRPIFISIYSNTGQSYGKSVTLLVDDVRVGYMDTASNDDAQLTAIIPPNSKYSVSFPGFVLSSNLWWMELR